MLVLSPGGIMVSPAETLHRVCGLPLIELRPPIAIQGEIDRCEAAHSLSGFSSGRSSAP